MWISQAHRPDLLASAFDGHERVVLRDSISSVLAHRAGRRVLAQIGNDAQDFPVQAVEALGGQTADVFLFASARVAGADVHHPPIRIAAAGSRIESHFTERMNW